MEYLTLHDDDGDLAVDGRCVKILITDPRINKV